ncbi:MAG: HEAT repeat domain-containing protein [Sedimentisphaeraceae bacterium JB056]
MKTKAAETSIIYLLIAIICFAQVVYSADEPAVNDQLVINRAMLSSGSDDQIRAVAAKQLLIDSDNEAKKIVINVLNDTENIKAIEAVCNAISQSQQWENEIQYPEAYIKPLIQILDTTAPEIAHQAAAALSNYEYKQIKSGIEGILYGKESSQQSRMNAIFAVGLRLSEKDAIAEMISLLDDKDPAIAEQAGKTLQGWVPMGTNKDLWNYVRNELKQKSPDEIVRDRLAAQETKVQKLSQEKQVLTSEIVSLYEQLYQTKNEPAARSEFLIEALKKKVPQVRRWAVEKIGLWRNSSDLPEQLTSAIVSVVSDDDSAVRLAAAKLMVYMADANPTDKLLAQLKAEEVAEVQTALLEALAESCYYALLPSSGLKLDPQTRIYVLDKASEFLAESNPERVVVGAEVVRKLLEKNGLEDAVASKYITNVNNRYLKALQQNNSLAAKLLNVMNRFCLADFHYRAIARKIFEPEFTKALSSTQPEIRTAAVEGFINIDKAVALKVLVEKQIYNDSDASIVKMVIDLAKEVGGGKDYSWLAEKVRQGVDGAWAAVIAILQREDASVVDKAVTTIDSIDIDDAKKIEIFEIGRKKAGIQYKSTVLLAHFYISRTKMAEAAELYVWLISDATGKSEAVNDAKNAIEALTAVDNNEAVIKLVTMLLNSGDIDPAGSIAAVLKKAVEKEGAALKTGLIKIAIPDSRPGWQKLVAEWKPAPKPVAAEPKSPEANAKPAVQAATPPATEEAQKQS